MDMYPCNPGEDWGQHRGKIYYDEIGADILLTLQDTWPLRGLSEDIKWIPWAPVDHDPIPPEVVNMLKHLAVVKPIAMTKWGQAQMKSKDIESYYIPHGVHTQCYSPNPEIREQRRARQGWEDTFVVGSVGTNCVERKNWSASLQGFAKFAKGKNDVVYYMHTEMNSINGLNLFALRENLGLEDITCFSRPEAMIVGIDEVEMSAQFNTMDVFLMPSKGEGFGIPLIEAQACGKPVITTRCTSHPELVGAGWFLEKLYPEWTPQASFQFDCDIDEIADKLDMAYQTWKSGGMIDMAVQARAKAMEYDWDMLIQDYWKPVLEDIEANLRAPKNCEGVQPWREILIPQTCNPRRVLDLGSGVTTPYKKLLSNLGEYVAVDSKGGENGVMKADAHNLPFKDKEFGFVFCSELLEHVDDPAQVVAEAKRVGNSGVIVFTTPTNPNFRFDPDHKVVELDYQRLATGDALIGW